MKRRLKRGIFLSVVDLQAAINRFVVEHNAEPKPFTWTAETDPHPKRALIGGKKRKALGSPRVAFVATAPSAIVDVIARKCRLQRRLRCERGLFRLLA
jgi:hypothetical protein